MPPWNTTITDCRQEEGWKDPPRASAEEQTNGCPMKPLPGAGGNMWACNYDFAHDNSHSSDLNVVPPLCEDNSFDEVLPLHLERDRTIHLHQRTPTPPTPLTRSRLG